MTSDCDAGICGVDGLRDFSAFNNKTSAVYLEVSDKRGEMLSESGIIFRFLRYSKEYFSTEERS